MAGSGIFPAELDIVPANPLDVDTGEMQQLLLNWLSANYQIAGAQPAGAATISSGSITPTRAITIIDTESAAASDDLTHAAVTSMEEGRVLFLKSTADARNVVVKHGSGGSGQFLLAGSADYTLDRTEQMIAFYRDGTSWVELMRFEGRIASATAGSNRIVISGAGGKVDSDYVDGDAVLANFGLKPLVSSISGSGTGTVTIDFTEGMTSGMTGKLKLTFSRSLPGSGTVRFKFSSSGVVSSANYQYSGRTIDRFVGSPSEVLYALENVSGLAIAPLGAVANQAISIEIDFVQGLSFVGFDTIAHVVASYSNSNGGYSDYRASWFFSGALSENLVGLQLIAGNGNITVHGCVGQLWTNDVSP